MQPHQRIYEQAAIEPEHLANDLHVVDETTVMLYDEDDEVIAETSYDEESWTTIGDAVVDSLEDASKDVDALDAAETVYLALEAPADSIAGMDTQGIDEHIRATYDGTPFDQDVMEHEYMDGTCNECGGDADFIVADPEKEDLDVYMYNCDDCGNTGHYFGGQESEDGAVTVRTEITDQDALEGTGVDIRDNASFTAFDLDMYDEQIETERVAVTDPGQLDAPVTVPDGGTVRVYPVDADHDVESVREEEIAYEHESETMTQTTVGELLEDAAMAEPVLASYLEELGNGRSLTVDLEAPADRPNGFAQERFDHSKYMDPLKTATFVENSSMRRLDGTVENLLTHVLHDYGQEWKDETDLKHMKGGRPPIVPSSTEATVKEHLKEPNFGLIVHDQTGGSDIEEPASGTYTKMIDESTVVLNQ